jgi:hypothetical protein
VRRLGKRIVLALEGEVFLVLHLMIAGRLHWREAGAKLPSPLAAGAAGVVTHVPGLIYLVVLNSIAADELAVASSAFRVTLYNALWFAVPIAALVLTIVAPSAANGHLDRAITWARAPRAVLLIGLFGGVGVYLILKGVLALT